MGDPTKATAEKGRILLDAAANGNRRARRRAARARAPAAHRPSLKRLTAFVLLAAARLSGCSPRAHSDIANGATQLLDDSGRAANRAARGSRQSQSRCSVRKWSLVDVAAFWVRLALSRWSDRSELVPELATVEPTQSNGGISRRRSAHHLPLRRNVTWQDGAPFTADDVIYTWQQMLNPRNMIVSRVGLRRYRADRSARRLHDRRPSQASVRAVRQYLLRTGESRQRDTAQASARALPTSTTSLTTVCRSELALSYRCLRSQRAHRNGGKR